MKNVTIAIVFLMSFIVGCATNSSAPEVKAVPEVVVPKRIVGKEYTIVNGHAVMILEVDGIEYLCGSHGICPLVKY